MAALAGVAALNLGLYTARGAQCCSLEGLHGVWASQWVYLLLVRQLVVTVVRFSSVWGFSGGPAAYSDNTLHWLVGPTSPFNLTSAINTNVTMKMMYLYC